MFLSLSLFIYLSIYIYLTHTLLLAKSFRKPTFIFSSQLPILGLAFYLSFSRIQKRKAFYFWLKIVLIIIRFKQSKNGNFWQFFARFKHIFLSLTNLCQNYLGKFDKTELTFNYFMHILNKNLNTTFNLWKSRKNCYYLYRKS
jgi:hypothetical protein